MLLCISLIQAVIISCDSDSKDSSASFPNVIQEERIEKELGVHLKTFLDESERRGIILDESRLSQLSIKYAPLPPNTLGQCIADEKGFSEIKISTVLIGKNSEWVTIHELGHCILHMSHRDRPLSIMNTTINTDEFNQIDRKVLFDEFFDSTYFEAFP